MKDLFTENEIYSMVKFYLEYSEDMEQIRRISMELLDGNTYIDIFVDWGYLILEYYCNHELNQEGNL